MEMDVINGLPCLPVTVENEPEAPLSHVPVLSYLPSGLEQLPDERIICGFNLKHTRNMLLRYNEYVYRGLWIVIFKGKHIFIFVDNVSRNSLFNNAAKKTGHDFISSKRGLY
jgi:hypothetical protein